MMCTSISLHVGTCDVSSSLSWFLFQVSLKFSPDTAVPAEDIVLTVSAQAGSLCGLSAIDQSVLIMESGRSLTPKRVSVCYLILIAPMLMAQLVKPELLKPRLE